MLGAKGVVREALAEREREEGEQDTEHDDMTAGRLSGFDGFQVALQGAAAQRAQPAELEASEMPAGVGERGVAQGLTESAVEPDEFADLAPGDVVIRVAHGGEFDRTQEALGVAVEQALDGLRRLGSGSVEDFGEVGEGRSGFRGAEGERAGGEVVSDLLAVGWFGAGDGEVGGGGGGGDGIHGPGRPGRAGAESRRGIGAR